MKRNVLVATLLTAVIVPSRGYSQEPADLAWDRGEIALAETLYAARLIADSSDQRALHRMALLKAWDDQLEASLDLLDRLIALAPENGEAARDRAQVLGWMGEFEAAERSYAEILRKRPGDTEARVGLGRVQLWSGQEARAEETFAAVLDASPDNAEALEGYAEAAGWDGRLGEAEDRWRRALDIEPDRVRFLLGLARTLRWQGRDAAAAEPIRLARALDPDDALVINEAETIAGRLASYAQPAATYESDSDGNRIARLSVGGMWRPVPRVGVELEVYRHETEDTFEERDATADGFWIGATGVASPGWTFSGAAGVDDGERESVTQGRVSIRTPGRYPFGGSIAASRRALNATTRSMLRGVTVDELAITGHVSPASGWWLEAGGSIADFHGRASNRRIAGHAYAQVALGRHWTIAVLSRGLAFELDVNEGYFDPSGYSVTEVELAWSRELGSWWLSASLAPGIQYLDDTEAWSATGNVFARAEYRFHPGRVLSIDAGMATAGVNSLTTGESDYRYYSIGASARWALSID